jgi:hypothetical protein
MKYAETMNETVVETQDETLEKVQEASACLFRSLLGLEREGMGGGERKIKSFTQKDRYR